MIASVVLVAAMPVNGGPEKGKREPIVITSRRMQADKLGDKVTFTGDVILKKEAMTLNSDSMIVFYDVATKGIREIEASGNVVVRKEGRVAFSNRAVYDSREEKIVLTGDPRIVENENQLRGEKITLFMRDDRSIVEGGKGLFYQDKYQGKQTEIKKRR
ncbi:MAG TPA: lipopolysaccharide transport periplasmic protein LptA [Nitrospirota bacterium]|nr:lipopolysaccharide transport periplasmic protein LptA [Nitrospirota bacterium]